MTARRAVVLTLLATVWVWAMWRTKDVDSDTGARSLQSPALSLTGKDAAEREPQARTSPAVGPGAPGAARDAAPGARASRSHRHLPAVLLRIRFCESRDRYDAENDHSSASGAYQILRGTWNQHRGYRTAGSAPRWVQDEKALLLYRDRGTQPWDASRSCWS